MTIYKLEHSYITKVINGESYKSTFLLGFFDCIDIVFEKIAFYKKQPGFRDHKNDFKITEYQLDLLLPEVYYVQHEYSEKNEDFEYDVVTEIGLYSTKDEAMSAIDLLKGDNDNLCRIDKDGFFIDCYPINNSYWIEGFSSW